MEKRGSPTAHSAIKFNAYISVTAHRTYMYCKIAQLQCAFLTRKLQWNEYGTHSAFATQVQSLLKQFVYLCTVYTIKWRDDERKTVADKAVWIKRHHDNVVCIISNTPLQETREHFYMNCLFYSFKLVFIMFHVDLQERALCYPSHTTARANYSL